MSVSKLPITELSLPGVLVIELAHIEDARGLFVETYNESGFKERGITTKFVQDNFSLSTRNVLRGMHFQRPPHAQAKLIRCALGEVFDVIADHNPESPNYGKHVSVLLTGQEGKILYIPEQYAHGFCVLSEQAIVEYKVSDFYHPECAGGVRYDDPLFRIPWPIKEPILSEKDRALPFL